MKNVFLKSLIFVALIIIYSCNSNKSGNQSMVPTVADSQSAKRQSNAISQSLPTLMVIPSDGLLKNLGCLTKAKNQGTTAYIRDYKKALIDNSNLKFAIAAIEKQFSKVGYPLENLEQQLKMIGNDNAMDEAESVARDLRAELMNTARPDYIIELEYEVKIDSKSRNLSKSLTYIVKCLDVYTNKAVSVVTRANVGEGAGDVASIIQADFPSSISELQQRITSNYADKLANGIEITLRIATMKNSGVALDNDCGEEEIGEQIINWLKENTVHSTYKMVKNTGTEMRFANVRIYTQDEAGNSYTAYDFAKDLKKVMKKGCGLDLANKTQSIGDAYLQIEGTKLALK